MYRVYNDSVHLIILTIVYNLINSEQNIRSLIMHSHFMKYAKYITLLRHVAGASLLIDEKGRLQKKPDQVQTFLTD